MTWRPDQRKAAPDVSWTLQVQYQTNGWWSDHTGNLFDRYKAETLLAERRSAAPEFRFRLVRVTTTRVVEAELAPAGAPHPDST